MDQSTVSHLHQKKEREKRKSMGVRRMASSTLIQTMVIGVFVGQFKSTPSASKLVGVLYRMDMKLESKLLSPLVVGNQLFNRLKCVRNIDHTTNTQKDSVLGDCSSLQMFAELTLSCLLA